MRVRVRCSTRIVCNFSRMWLTRFPSKSSDRRGGRPSASNDSLVSVSTFIVIRQTVILSATTSAWTTACYLIWPSLNPRIARFKNHNRFNRRTKSMRARALSLWFRRLTKKSSLTMLCYCRARRMERRAVSRALKVAVLPLWIARS